MPRFFIPSDCISDNQVIIRGSDAHHLSHVLRMAKGDIVTLCDMGRREHECKITDFRDGEVELEIISTTESSNEPTVKVTLYQGLPKGDKLEQIIQKGVELGVYKIVPVEAERSVVKVKDGYDKKLARYNAIALAAAKQCGRAYVPTVEAPVRFKDTVEALKSHSLSFICYEGTDVVPLRTLAERAFCEGASDVGFYIGPEGGLSNGEILLAKENDIALCGLGKRILRTETASGCVLSALMLLSGNLE